MGSVIGTFVSDVGGSVLGFLTAPIRDTFNKQCEDVCGAWDGICFITHKCGKSLIQLGLSSILAVIAVFFLYFLYKIRVCKCVAKITCKLSWKACWGSCRALGGACGFLWRKLRDTKRVYRGRRQRRDVEMGDLGSWSGGSGTDDESRGASASYGAGGRARGIRSPSSSVRERRKDRVRQSLRLRRQISKVEHAARRSPGDRRSLHHGATEPRRKAEVPSSLRLHAAATHGRPRVHRAHER